MGKTRCAAVGMSYGIAYNSSTLSRVFPPDWTPKESYANVIVAINVLIARNKTNLPLCAGGEG